VCYNYPVNDLPNTSPLTGTFRPLASSRTGEIYAWALAGVLAISALILFLVAGSVPWFVWLLFAFFLVSAILSTFSYWVDAHTVLEISEEGVAFRNGLRNVRLAWPDVAEVRIHSDRWGKRVQVQGKDGQHFAFRTLAEVEIHEGRPQKLFGFPNGEQLAESMIRLAGLQRQHQTADEVYYARA